MPAASNLTRGYTAADNLREIPVHKVKRRLFGFFTIVYSVVLFTARTLGHADILPAASLACSLAAHAVGVDNVC